MFRSVLSRNKVRGTRAESVADGPDVRKSPLWKANWGFCRFRSSAVGRTETVCVHICRFDSQRGGGGTTDNVNVSDEVGWRCSCGQSWVTSARSQLLARATNKKIPRTAEGRRLACSYTRTSSGLFCTSTATQRCSSALYLRTRATPIYRAVGEKETIHCSRVYEWKPRNAQPLQERVASGAGAS